MIELLNERHELIMKLKEIDERISRQHNFISNYPNSDILFGPLLGSNISTRAKNMLRDECMFCLVDLLPFSSKDLSRIPNIGKRTVTELEEYVLSKGLRLPFEMPDVLTKYADEKYRGGVSRSKAWETSIKQRIY